MCSERVARERRVRERIRSAKALKTIGSEQKGVMQ